MHNEYVMLALRSKGINTIELKNLFGSDWLKKNNLLLAELKSNNFIFQNGNLLSLTPKGYSICDEILTKLKS